MEAMPQSSEGAVSAQAAEVIESASDEDVDDMEIRAALAGVEARAVVSVSAASQMPRSSDAPHKQRHRPVATEADVPHRRRHGPAPTELDALPMSRSCPDGSTLHSKHASSISSHLQVLTEGGSIMPHRSLHPVAPAPAHENIMGDGETTPLIRRDAFSNNVGDGELTPMALVAPATWRSSRGY